LPARGASLFVALLSLSFLLRPYLQQRGRHGQIEFFPRSDHWIATTASQFL